MFKLQLSIVTNVRGSYEGGKLPARMCFLHPDAAAAFVRIASSVIVSDMFRSPESSLAAIRAKRGAKPPSFSAHNYGLAIDVDLKPIVSKKGFDEFMRENGWFCHRSDHKMLHEAWHYNFLGGQIAGKVNSPAAVEEQIKALYGQFFSLDPKGMQTALKRLNLYSGEIDGLIGPLTREALRVFQRGWGLKDTGRLDEKTSRTLAYVACEREIVQRRQA